MGKDCKHDTRTGYEILNNNNCLCVSLIINYKLSIINYVCESAQRP